jgi:predicted ATPase
VRFTHLRLANWRNFKDVDVKLEQRVFMVGPNASGKSNLLDVFRFLRDIADPQGGFMRAIERDRGGVSQLRSLHARLYSTVVVDVGLDLDGIEWEYRLEFNQDKLRRPQIKREIVRQSGEVVRERPDDHDRADPSRLSQTHLEQVNANREFREVASFFAQVRYLHLVPQLVREPDRSVGKVRDPFGGDFLEQLALTPQKTLDSRLRRIRDALRVAVPQLRELELKRDKVGVPHLRGLYEHWRPNAGWQTERQFSDGTLRLLGLLWVLLDGQAPLLLEEPELSLHTAVIRHIPAMIGRLNRKTGRQVIVSTHSADLLSDEGIAPEEVLLLEPGVNGTGVKLASDDSQIRALLDGGASMAEAVLPRTAPRDAAQLSLFPE